MGVMHRIKRRWRLIRFAYGRFIHHFSDAIRRGASISSGLAVIASLGCLVCMLLYFGYDHSEDAASRLRLGIRFCQGVFVFDLIFRLLFSFRKTIRETRWLKWIIDILLLTTVLPWIYPRPDRPWIPILEEVLYNRAFLFGVLAVYSVFELCYGMMLMTSRRTNPSLLMSGSFLFFILIGSLVLMLPKCTVQPIGFIDSLFVSTSAVCITGLTSVDVPSTFTPYGLVVLAVLMQIGGLGVLTFTSFFALFFSGTTSVYNQLLIRDLVYSKTMNALIPTLLYILGFTLTIEAVGAVAVYFMVPDQLGLEGTERIMFACFHSLSAFCNAGFSCLPGGLSNEALMTYGQSVYAITSVLIFAGAIGFPILVNFKEILSGWLRRIWARLRHTTPDVPLHLFDLNTKLVLVTYIGIMVFCSVAFFFLEYDNTLAGMSLGEKINQAVFNSLTPRSAGFMSVNPADFMSLTLLMVIVQMWIGGASQSLGGGIKVNTVAAIFLNVRAIITGRARPWAFHRTVSVGSIRRANAVISLAVGAFVLYMALELWLEPGIGLKPLTFEVVSALFTVGSSLGATEMLGDASKCILCTAMFLGRVGIVSLLAGLAGNRRDFSRYLPEDKIIIN